MGSDMHNAPPYCRCGWHPWHAGTPTNQQNEHRCPLSRPWELLEDLLSKAIIEPGQKVAPYESEHVQLAGAFVCRWCGFARVHSPGHYDGCDIVKATEKLEQWRNPPKRGSKPL